MLSQYEGMVIELSPKFTGAYRFSVAPMLDCTDRHFRVLMRQISRKAWLYTEMIVAKALQRSNRLNQLLDFDDIEHPISLQIGGDDPEVLAEAARLADAWGYDEINLNIGCPSPRVQSGKFGACMMANPDLVARCVEAMSQASPLSVTVKHRIGIDNLDSDILLTQFVDRLASAGAKRFTIHARKAWLKGLNPKQNRTIPPLEYDRVTKLKRKRPELIIELNGGLNTQEDCLNALLTFDGVMVGRSAYEHPLRWRKIDEVLFQDSPRNLTASKVIHGMIPYAQKHINQGGRLWDICRHVLQIVENTPGAKAWRRDLSLQAQTKNADLKVLEIAARKLEDVGL